MIQKRPAAPKSSGNPCPIGERDANSAKKSAMREKRSSRLCMSAFPGVYTSLVLSQSFSPVIGFFQSSRHAFFRPLHKRLHASRIFSSQSSLHVMTKCQDPPHASPKAAFCGLPPSRTPAPLTENQSARRSSSIPSVFPFRPACSS